MKPTTHVQATAALLLSLPTLSQAAYVVILVAFLGVLLAGLLGDAPIRLEPIVLSLFLLPARAVMGLPDRRQPNREEIAELRMFQENGDYQRLQQTINILAQDVYGWQRSIGLSIISKPIAAYSISSWGRDCLVLGSMTARRLATELRRPEPPDWVRALLLHEIAHIVHRDQQRVGFAGELLRGAVTILPWWIFFLVFWIGTSLKAIEAALAFDFNTVPGMPAEIGEWANSLIALEPNTKAEILARASSISFSSLLNFIILSFVPIALISIILYLFYWRWMVRLQEHYADLTISRLGVNWRELEVAQGALLPLGLSKSPNSLRARLQPYLRMFRRRFSGRWFSLHPTLAERRAVLADPSLLYTNWRRIAWSVAFLSIGLDVILASPLFAYYGVFTHLYVLTAFVLLSTWLLPQLVTGRSFVGDLMRILLVLFAVRVCWLMLNIVLLVIQVLFFPTQALALMNAIAIAGSRYVGELSGPPIVDPGLGLSAAGGAILLELLQSFGLIVAIGFYILSQQSFLKRAPTQTQEIRQNHWLSVFVISVVVLTLIYFAGQQISGS